MPEWVAARSGRQIAILQDHLGLPASETGKRKKVILDPEDPRLLPYLLVQEFASFKARAAVAEYAAATLPAAVLDACRRGESDFDTQALCFSLFRHSPDCLRDVLHFDQVHKHGFARMILKKAPRQPKRAIGEFLDHERLSRLLSTFDEEKGDGRAGDFKNVLCVDGSYFVFIRRCERPTAILRDKDLVHGHRREWIVLEFLESARRVNISSISVDVPLEIANRIASEYFGKPCEYENESAFTHPQQIRQFFECLRRGTDNQLKWVELTMARTPLPGACGMKLSDPESRPIGPAVTRFEKSIGKLVSHLDDIDNIKVLFAGKRVSLQFEKPDEESLRDVFEVRYSDHRLNPRERRAFETHMRSTHEIPVLSTEKRFKRQS